MLNTDLPEDPKILWKELMGRGGQVLGSFGRSRGTQLNSGGDAGSQAVHWVQTNPSLGMKRTPRCAHVLVSLSKATFLHFHCANNPCRTAWAKLLCSLKF